MAEWARQEDAELIEESEHQAIMDAYQYGSTMSVPNQEDDIVDPPGKSRSIPKHTPQQHRASASPWK